MKINKSINLLIFFSVLFLALLLTKTMELRKTQSPKNGTNANSFLSADESEEEEPEEENIEENAKEVTPQKEKAETPVPVKEIVEPPPKKQIVEEPPAEKEPPPSAGYFGPKLCTIRHVEGFYIKNPIFFNTNYTSLSVVLSPTYNPGTFLPLVDLRGFRFTNANHGMGAGLVLRFPIDTGKYCYSLGGYGFYLLRQGAFGSYQQSVIGLEFLSKNWELRANAYVPIGTRKRTCGRLFTYYDGEYWAEFRCAEESPYGFSAEIGNYLVHDKNFLLYVGLGPYYMFGRSDFVNATGFQARIRPQYTDFFWIEANYRYDRFFRSMWQGEIAIQLPLYRTKRKKENSCGMLDYQMYQNARFFEIIPLAQTRNWRTNY